MHILDKLKQGTARNEEMVLLCVNIANVSEALELLSPEDCTLFLGENVDACEIILATTGGSIINVIGTCIMGAWNTGDIHGRDKDISLNEIALKILNRIEANASKFARFKAVVAITFAAGPCVFERKGDRYFNASGAGLAKLLKMAEKASDTKVTSVFIDSILTRHWRVDELELVEDGIFRVLNRKGFEPTG